VHKLMCAGTVEEKIDRLLETKRGLASKVVGSGERWITELEPSELRELFALSKNAVIGPEDAADEPAGAALAAARRGPARPRREESA
jgi:hypothetical protein